MKKHYLLAGAYGLLLSSLLAHPATAQNTRLDPTFQLPVILNAASPGTVRDVVRQADGKYVIGGTFTSINGVRARNLARLNADGTLDAAFTANSAANRPVYSLALQPDGRILAGGQFDSLAGAPRTSVGRLLPTGALDAAFNANQGPYLLPAIEQVALLPGDDVLALSPRSPSFGVPAAGLYRLSGLSGQVDGGFQQAVPALRFAVQSDGRILTGGGGGSYILMHLLARLLPNGSLDPSFAHATTYYTSTTLQLEVDARDNIYRLGAWSSNSGRGLSGPGITQNDWGTLSATGFRRQPNGRFLIGGLSASAGLPLTTRLLPDGLQDVSYLASAGPRASATGIGQVHRFLPQPDGAVMIAGNFTVAGTTPVHGLVRMLDTNVLTTRNELAEQGTAVWPVPASETVSVSLEATAQPQKMELIDAVGRVVLTQEVASRAAVQAMQVAALPAGVYALRVSYAQGGPVVRRIEVQR